MWRHTPQAARLMELMPRIGEPVSVRSTFSHRLRDDADIRVSAELEGGSLMDVGCYCVSGARLVAGQEPDVVYGQQLTTADGVDRRFAALLHFPSGLTATFHCGFDSFSETLEMIGRDGTIYLPDPGTRRRGSSSSTARRCGSSPSTHISASSTTWRRRSAARRHRASAARMPRAKHGPSRPSTAPPPKASRSAWPPRTGGRHRRWA